MILLICYRFEIALVFFLNRKGKIYLLRSILLNYYFILQYMCILFFCFIYPVSSPYLRLYHHHHHHHRRVSLDKYNPRVVEFRLSEA